MNPIQSVLKALNNIYDVTEDDLRANARGVLSTKQHEGYAFIIYRSMPIGLIIAWIVTGLFTLFLIKRTDPYNLLPDSTNFLRFTAVISLIVVTLLVGYHWFNMRRDFETNVVENTSGVVSTKFKQNIHSVTVNEMTFHNPQGFAASFEHGKHYRIYYMPRSKLIVSFEALT